MRREIYEAICKALLATNEIQYVDLWNQNVEFIEQENNWPRPAVFVEFDPIKWDRTKEKAMRTTSTIKLHIVTDWLENTAAENVTHEDVMEVFRYPAIVQEAIEGLRGATFGSLVLEESHTNHNHEELIESIEVYRYRGLVHL